MKKILYIMVLIPMVCLGQTTTENYVKTTTYKKPTTAGAVNTANPAEAAVNVTYFDGLGRPVQQVAGRQTTSGKDIITPIEYDDFGRQQKEYLPFASTQNTLAHNNNATLIGNLVTQYTGLYGDTNPYSEKLFENSPLNRVLKQAAPGNAWAMGSGKEIKMEYKANNANEVKLYRATGTWNATKALYDISLSNSGGTVFYGANQLVKTITKDENWQPADGDSRTTQEFKDKDGRVVMKRTYGYSMVSGVKTLSWHETYYLYDQYGNLTYVIPPLVSGTLTASKLEGLCYMYKYDYRNRLVEKKLPGKEWEFMVYDKLDRVVATGPALTPFGGTQVGWIITEYDAFSRVVKTGWKQMSATATDRKNHQATVNAGTNPFVMVTNDLLTQNYYDNYSFTGVPPLPSAVEGQTIATSVKGLPTGNWVRILDNSSVANAEVSYTLYDAQYRPIRQYTANFLGGYTQTDTKLDWAGKVDHSLTAHKYKSTTALLTVKDSYSYTPQDKLDIHKHMINAGNEVLISKNNYDELGQLITKRVGGDATGATSFQKIDYKYNIRGWLIELNDVNDLVTDEDLFAYKLGYNSGTNPLYNGNISEAYWRSSNDNVLRKYDYKYDELNRLLEANYKKPSTSSTVDSYLEKLKYDKNGNIVSLVRNGDLDANDFAIEIDNLNYTYHSTKNNQLMKVLDKSNHPKGFKDDSNGITDAEEDYDYDSFGNLIKDQNKQITSISYNHLNLPVVLQFVGGGSITYLYNASGQKLRKTTVDPASTTTIVDYMNGGFQYVGGILSFFSHAEGYVNVTLGNKAKLSFDYVYQYRDHLGNNRMNFAQSSTIVIGEEPSTMMLIMEEDHYYPFGMKHSRYNTNLYGFVEVEDGTDYYVNLEQMPNDYIGAYKYKFQGQELQDELGLGWYSFKWRNYDPAIARFMSIDPLTESYEDYTPYQFASNQPVHAQEIEGLENAHDLNKRVLTREARNIVNDAIPKAKTQTMRTPSPSSSSSKKVAPVSQTMVSQDKMSPSARKQHDTEVRAQMAETENLKQAMNNHENLGSPYTAKTVMEGVVIGIPMVMIPGGSTASVATQEGYAVIGEGMEAVNATKSAMASAGFENVATFQASDAALSEWAQLTSNGARVSDDIAKGTKLFQENQTWIQGMKDSGRTIIDIGRDGRKVQSTFYNMERQVIYGK